jgi:hypothetical protein
MDRREFISSGAASAALVGLPLSAAGQARPKHVLVVASES